MNAVFVAILLICTAPDAGHAAADPAEVGPQQHMNDHEAAAAIDEEDEVPSPRKRDSFLLWLYKQLGFRYAFLLPGSGLAVFLGGVAVAARARRPAPLAAYLLLALLPFFIGVFAAIEGMFLTNFILSQSARFPRMDEFASGYAASLVAVLVGMVATAPTYLLIACALVMKCLALPPLERESSKVY
jgi:hypothetical protein